MGVRKNFVMGGKPKKSPMIRKKTPTWRKGSQNVKKDPSHKKSPKIKKLPTMENFSGGGGMGRVPTLVHLLREPMQSQ